MVQTHGQTSLQGLIQGGAEYYESQPPSHALISKGQSVFDKVIFGSIAAVTEDPQTAGFTDSHSNKIQLRQN